MKKSILALMSVMIISASMATTASASVSIKTVIKTIATIIGIGRDEGIPCWSASDTSENGGTYVICSTCSAYPGDYKGPQGTCRP